MKVKKCGFISRVRLVFSVFFTNLIVKNEPNLECFQKYRESDAENLGSLCFIVHKKIDSQTDRQTDRQTDMAKT